MMNDGKFVSNRICLLLLVACKDAIGNVSIRGDKI